MRYWKVIPIRGGKLIAISVFEVLEFFLTANYQYLHIMLLQCIRLCFFIICFLLYERSSNLLEEFFFWQNLTRMFLVLTLLGYHLGGGLFCPTLKFLGALSPRKTLLVALFCDF
jgi:hypothetical protein